ncbi:dipeptide ABC transporter ATP-binding protein [Rhizobium multihospitium]|uniref:Peptide/nickel transport system ATP-binding protein n=1 Tax=Rhizobium multihospitium TaxID=410764 RepID=A0A1C3WW58_9HYPH|nr:ABC transporter ATP-binding protein [Rhizobium multihospitium]SCB44218.1 peptide/nickel transport system ATP-binding protein [Rhizobium multihospitium]
MPNNEKLVSQPPILDIRGLSISYRTAAGSKPAVSDISFYIRRGEVLGLVGESGSGKSSVAMAVLNYLPAATSVSAERIDFEGRDLRGNSSRALRNLRGSRISAVYQNPGAALNPALTIGRQITEILQAHLQISMREALIQAVRLLEAVHIRNPRTVLKQYPHQISGGMQQRVLIAMAIALKPSLVVLDEPTTALDASVQSEIITILGELRRDHDTAFLLISHDIHLVRQLADRIAVMQDGRIVETGPTEQVLQAPAHSYTRHLLRNVPSLGSPSSGKERLADAITPKIPILQCANLVHSFGGRRVLDGVTFEIAAGETFGLIGESGSGKTTLARIVAGLQPGHSGQITLMGNDIGKVVERRSPEQRRNLSMVFQSPDRTLNPRLRLSRILKRALREDRHGADRISEMLRAVGLPQDFARRLPRELSGGQRQRIAIARAFAGKPRLVILDEPTSALDVSVQARILDLLQELQSAHDTAYLFISHDLRVVRQIAKRVGVLYRGQLVECGATEEVFANPKHPYTRQLLLTLAFQSSSPVQTSSPWRSYAASL